METKRLVWIDLLNIVACAGVLLLHSTNGEVHSFSGIPSADWYIGLFTHSFFLWPVNVFFMISGFTLLQSLIVNKYEWGGVKQFYNKRLKRLAFPVIAWNTLYMLMYILRSILKENDLETFPNMIKHFLLFEYNGYMWFFVPLIMIYLSLPFFSVFVHNADRQLLRLYLIIGLIMGCIPPLDPEFTIRENFSNIYLMGSRFLYFTVAGYYIGHYHISYKTRRMIYICSLLSMITVFTGTMLLTLYMPNHYNYFIEYINIPCTISAMGVFLFFKYHKWENIVKNAHTENFIVHWSSCSLGIYLIQSAWFTLLGHLHICDNHILLKFIVMYMVCIISVWIIKHIPIMKKTV